ncbi:MurR/RpiR family transcriptional regulator [Luteimonas sp. SJ-92]|uniref:MurR/RpiR family transcriptional regulator n=1 Tax=Luteimonas salinisoli TaxID=2752307 RepID=A0A853JEL4_9GAMM|nr:MurR/RpiR family transcriptional regulator [Luteimonas salinisoli]NZA27000.1 MurR/RpiR family transcriptional regulator [Luteimonas salinisoli]
MSSLLRIRSQRDQMSAIERRIADFILDNAHLLRDYSSQQLANALEVSQSSVVKFSQKLGYKGYPDLKYAVGEDMARSDGQGDGAVEATGEGDRHAMLAETLWQAKSNAEQETRLLNPPETLDAIADAIHRARTVFVIGLGHDSIAARGFTLRLSEAGILAVFHFDPVLMPTSLANAGRDDVLVVFSEHGRRTSLCELSRLFRERIGAVISVTRHSANPLRAQADLALLVSGHDERSHIEQLLYQSALQHLLDLVFMLLCEHAEERMQLLDRNAARMRQLLET